MRPSTTVSGRSSSALSIGSSSDTLLILVRSPTANCPGCSPVATSLNFATVISLMGLSSGDPPPYTQLTTIGHDPETDVHVLVHGREKAGKSSVHDHSPCWVVYGNYRNPTRMRRWRRLDDGSRPGYAELELQREFLNERGHAAAFAVGDIHSIEYGDDTFFLRVTGGDLETKDTRRFDVERRTVEVASRAPGQR